MNDHVSRIPADISAMKQYSSRWTLPKRRFRLVQKRHFILCVLLPALATVVGVFLLPSEAFLWPGPTIAVTAWLLVGGLGMSVGFHRHFSHRSFSAIPILRYVMGALGSMAAQGSVIYWTSLHRRHHSLSDKPGDPHSPTTRANGYGSKIRAFLQGHVLWAVSHDVPKPSRYTPDLLADPLALSLARHYWFFVMLGIGLPALTGYFVWHGPGGILYGAYWGGIVRLAVGHQIIWAVNSVCHSYGQRPNSTGDESTNNLWLAIISFGESWHNNHHHCATSARFGRRWCEVDLGWIMIRIFKSIGAVHDVKG
jgi:stearoyl-CoA desaturase (delta-9 desaturase)